MFSVSALNNYLDCPWKYFFRNLVRLPENPDKFALYGTVVHHALEQFFRKWKEEGKDPGAEFLMERFQFYLERVPIAAREYEEMRAKGEKALPGYYAQYHKEWNTNIQCEFPIKGVELEISMSNTTRSTRSDLEETALRSDLVLPDLENNTHRIILRGMLDKVEFLGGNKVNVVDYKTAKPKSRNVIEGNTKDSDGNYKRQLVFYKLLLDRYDDPSTSSGEPKFVMETGEIDFIEPDKKGKYHKEQFPVTKAEADALAAEVERVTEEILSFAFWDKRCVEEKCEYCKLRNAVA